jgi:hypothetical protein
MLRQQRTYFVVCLVRRASRQRGVWPPRVVVVDVSGGENTRINGDEG